MPEQQEEKTAKNTVTIEQAGPCRKKIIVEIPKETISKLTDEQYEVFRKDALGGLLAIQERVYSVALVC